MATLLAWLVLILSTVAVAVAAVVCIYHAALMLVAACCGVGVRRDAGAPSHSFAIVIPAHDEESMIGRALDSCARLDYPVGMRTVYVIADNCSDRTAEVAKSRGAICLIRHDEERRGKGFALAWALPQVLAAEHDAVLILDADCCIEPPALLAFDDQLRGGGRALQANDAVANPDGSATCCVLAVANLLENDFFYAPKSALGLAVFLRGTGMVFHREVLLQLPWQAESIVEDAEYTCQLLEAGVAVRFVPDIRVVSDFPVRREQLTVQRERWVGGGLRMAVARGPRLVGKALRTGRLVLLDAAVTMVITSRPIVIGQFLLAVGVTLLAWWLAPGPWATTLMAIAAAIAAVYVGYVAVGIAWLGVTPRRVRLLASLPVCVASYLLMAATGLARRNAASWTRTPRSAEVGGSQTVAGPRGEGSQLQTAQAEE